MPLDNDELIIKDKAVDGASTSADFDEFWRIFFGRLHVIIFITIVGLVGCAVYNFRLPDIYVASSKIIVERPEQKEKTSSNIVQGVGAATKEEDYFGTQIFLITGRKISEAVALELGKSPYGYKVNARRLRGTRII